MTQAAILARLLKYLPISWYANSTLIQAIMNASASVFYYIYTLFDYLRLQSRIQTSFSTFLDWAWKDFYGDFLPRQIHETDSHFLRRILPSLLQYPSTRQGLIDAITNIFGIVPALYESMYDGAYLDVNFFVDETGICGFDAPYQGIIYVNIDSSPALNISTYALDVNFYVDEQNFCFDYEDLIVTGWTIEDVRLVIERFKVCGTVIYLNTFTQINSFQFPNP